MTMMTMNDDDDDDDDDDDHDDDDDDDDDERIMISKRSPQNLLQATEFSWWNTQPPETHPPSNLH